MIKVNSYNIRAILMYYYRRKRQLNCSSEVKTDSNELADILVDTNKQMIEIEIKISKYDLFKGEARKKKHKKDDKNRIVNKFFICVPTELVDDAKKWIKDVNPKYGLIEFNVNDLKYVKRRYDRAIHFVEYAKVLQPIYKSILKKRMFKRLSNALITEYMGKMK